MKIINVLLYSILTTIALGYFALMWIMPELGIVWLGLVAAVVAAMNLTTKRQFVAAGWITVAAIEITATAFGIHTPEQAVFWFFSVIVLISGTAWFYNWTSKKFTS